MKDKYTPQWLKEVLERGFKPAKIYHDFDKSLFSYIDIHDDKKHIAPNCKVYSLEGLPGTGKTTLIERFRGCYGVDVVNQILPNEPIDDKAMPMSFYLNSEELKTKEAINCIKDICILDRYYVSTLAFYWAYDKINHTNEYECAYKWYKTAIISRKIWQPFTVYYIEINSATSIIRKNRKSSESRDNLWENRNFLDYFNDYYDYFYKKIEPRTRLCRISGNLSLEEIEEFIRKDMNEK